MSVSGLSASVLDAPAIPVVAGVLRDAFGRVLLAQRTAGRAHAGLWEYPGGKIEAGEAPVAALARELHEELGVDIDQGGCRPLIRIPFDYGSGQIVLQVIEVVGFDGEPQGREGQDLRWCTASELGEMSMPAADRPVAAALFDPPCYAITPEPGADDASFLAEFSVLVKSGIGRVQLRARSIDEVRLRRLAIACANLANGAGVELLLNGATELARELGLGLHLRAAQLADVRERPIAADLPLAASCHTATELALAEAVGVDFAVLGPVLSTQSHPDAKPIGWPGFADIRRRCSLPIYALGGLAREDLATARAHGAQGVAAIRGFWPG